MKRYFSDLMDSLLKMYILIVDDSPEYAQIFSDNITDDCKQLITGITELQKVIELVKSQSQSSKPFDAVFIDYMMPGMNGLVLCKRLFDVNPALPLIIISTDSSIKTQYELSAFRGISVIIVKNEPVENKARMLCILLSNKILAQV